MTRILPAALMLFALFAGIASAQDDTSDAAKTRKIGVHLSGTVTLTGIACPPGTATGDECYDFSGTLKQGKFTGNTTGVIVTSGTPTPTKKGTCYTVINTSTENFEIAGIMVHTDLNGPGIQASLRGEACIKTTKKGSTESLVGGAWETTPSSIYPGKGKEAFKGMPTDPMSTTSPLAGTGTVHLTGSITVPRGL
ncbi:MAG TPA: hypothetical protein VMT64_00810 [Candidatus Binataceae bacterium]|nr:hypothetical protein [Candidatus Binataceae bacterium]